MRSTMPTSLLLLLLGLAGCSSFGPDGTSNRYMPGRTSREQVTDFFGEPNEIDTGSVAGDKKLIYRYRFADAQPKPPELFRGVWQVPQKNLVMEFVNDTLHGYLFNNSMDHSSTNFNKGLRGRILIGRADKSVVHDLLGEPAGKIILPTSLFGHPFLKNLAHVVPLHASEVWCYYYDYLYFRAGTRRRFEYYRFLAVYFNTDGLVVDKFYNESDRVEPRITRIYTD